MRPLYEPLLSAADISVDQTSSAIDAQFMLAVSIQATLTGSSPTGTLKLQGSNDYGTTTAAPTHWNDIGSSVSISATGVYIIPYLSVCYQWVRLAWVATSGTGTITANIKTVGETMREVNIPAIVAQGGYLTSASSPILADQLFAASAQLVATGALAAGSFKLQASNDSPFVPPNTVTNWSTLGSTVTVSGSGSYLIPKTDISYQWLRVLFTSTSPGVQTIAPIAATGVKQAQTITAVADVAGSLNSTYFLVSSINLVSKAQKNFYVWLDDGAGVDPALAGKTGVHVTYADGDSANTIAGNIRTAMAALTNDWTITGATSSIIITDKAAGPVTAAVDGTAATGFTFGAATAGVASNLNNKYFLLSSANAGTAYYVWISVDSIGTDPAVAGKTGVPIAISSGATAATVGTALASAIDALAEFVATGTTTVTVTNSAVGPFTAAVDSVPAPTGFTIAIAASNGTTSVNVKVCGV